MLNGGRLHLIITNEKTYAENLLNSYGLDDNPYQAITILAKYYYHHLGYRKKKIIRNLTNYLEKNYPRYHVAKLTWASTIEKIAGSAGKYPLHQIDEIWITQSELDTIESIDTNEFLVNVDDKTKEKLKRLVFTMLCIAKLNAEKNPKSNGWVNTEIKDLLQLSRISCTQKQGSFLISYLNAAGLLEFAKKNTNLSRRVTFMDDEGEKVLQISDFRELGYAYLKYRGENIINCGQCGILIRGNVNNSRRYCNDCNGSKPMVEKRIACADCGIVFAVSAKNNKTCRCVECQKVKDKENTRKRVQRFRGTSDDVTVTNPE